MLQEPRHKTQENQEPIPRPRKQYQDQKQETRTIKLQITYFGTITFILT